MFIPATRRQAQLFDPAVIAPLRSPRIAPWPTPRGEHAKLLLIAAARRLRAAERSGLQRHEDAQYWKEVAPVAIAKARTLRAGLAFQRLP